MQGVLEQLRQSGGLSGGVQEGDAIEVVNVSAAPEKAFHTDHASRFEVGAGGKLQGESAGFQAGDHLRVRARRSNGQASNWIAMQAGGMGEDTRNAQIGPRGLGIIAEADGSLRPMHLGGGMLSEPGATIQLKHMATGEVTQFQLDEEGRLPADLSLQGNAGDQFQLAVSDGTNNLDFSWTVVGHIEAKEARDIEDPQASNRYSRADGSATVNKVRYTGPLFKNGASVGDVSQGSLGNCYFCAAAASVAHSHPEVIENMMQDNGDGTYTVTFQIETPENSGLYEPHEVTVDGELYLRHNQTPLYGAANADKSDTDDMEMWFPILEKAYAKLKDDGYQNIESGWSHKMMMMFMGAKHNDEYLLSAHQMDNVYEQLAEAAENGWPGTAVTFAKDSPEGRSHYAGSRIYASHAYSLMGVHEENGEKFVQLRNPWGSSEPGYDGKDDGIFLLPLEKVPHYFQWLNVTHSPS
jgi:hypothetical protein